MYFGAGVWLFIRHMVNKYLNSYSRFVRNSLEQEIEYRGGFIFNNITGLIWVIGAFFFIYILFTQTNTVSGWDKQQVICLYLTFSATSDLFNIFIRDNLRKFIELVRTGQLDTYIMKPLNLVFLLSLMSGRLAYYVIFRFFLAVGLLIYFAPHTAPVFPWLLYLGFLITGLIGVYSVIFMLHTLNIWLIRMDNLTDLANSSFELAKVPLNAWPNFIRWILIYLFPIGILSTFAVRALFNQIGITDLFISLIISGALFIVSQKFFVFALRRYSSASS